VNLISATKYQKPTSETNVIAQNHQTQALIIPKPPNFLQNNEGPELTLNQEHKILKTHPENQKPRKTRESNASKSPFLNLIGNLSRPKNSIQVLFQDHKK
jgi:hypothetical protein